MKKILNKIADLLIIILSKLVWITIGIFIAFIFFSTKGLLEARETEEFANLLRIEAERYDYCPYCGEKLEYKYNCNIVEEEKQRIINEYFGE